MTSMKASREQDKNSQQGNIFQLSVVQANQKLEELYEKNRIRSSLQLTMSVEQTLPLVRNKTLNHPRNDGNRCE